VLSIDDSPALKYDELVIATGANPRRIEGIDGDGVHVVRTMEDSMALRAAMTEHRRVVIVGGGFIGTEVAATARSMGIEVTLVEAMDAPLARVVGTGPADEIARLHLEAGVDLRCSTSVLESLGQGDERVVRLSDGSEIDAPVLLLAVGASPSVDWLTGSGVEVDDGVVCDGQGRTSVPHVWAIGDVASWWQSLAGAPVRLEHWTSAAEQGVAVAHALMGRQVDVDLVPYFWSDQYGKKLQMVGLPAADDDVTINWVGPAMGGMLALYGRGGRATGVLGIHAVRQVTRLRPLLARAASYDELLAAADEG
jgi:3-phenylpropionate/trans-cinnamate dioxygenase ferredoxin reductase subunit